MPQNNSAGNLPNRSLPTVEQACRRWSGASRHSGRTASGGLHDRQTGRLGVMMHVADDPALHELRPKGSHSKTYLGLEAPSGQVQGREILSINEREMVMS